jgi:hypothetical protein
MPVSRSRRVAAVSSVTISLIAVFAGAVQGSALASPQRPAATAASTYDSAVLADAPRFYWPLDETSGAVRDLTGHAAASSVTSAQLGVPGAAGTAASFDGASQRVEVPYTTSMQLPASFSVELWAKLPATPQATGWPTLFSRGSVAGGHFGAAMWLSSDSTHAVHFKRNGIDVGTSRGLTSTGYRHVVFTWDNNAKRWSFYVDGTADNTGVASGLSGVDREQLALEIGAMRYSATAAPANYGNVLVDGLAMYTGVLPAARIAAHYAAGTAGPSPSPTPSSSPSPSPTVSASPTPTSTPTSTPSATGYVGGVAVGGLQPWNTRRAADYKDMGAAHSTWIRSDLAWEYLEPVKGEWRFYLYDPVVTDTTAAGMRYLAVLHTVPAWANGGTGDYGLPSDLSLLQNYCYQAVKHYLPMGVSEYEIGNEVNLPHPGWNYDPATYTNNFLKPCVTGVRQAAGEVGGRVTILLGSFAPIDWSGGTHQATFLTGVYANGGAGWFDATAWHPYTGADSPVTARQMNNDPAQLASIMAGNGDGAKKIWATEFGQASGGTNSVTEAAQQDLVSTGFNVWYSKPYAGPLFWYSARDTGTSATDREQHFGVLRNDGSHKPAYATLQSVLVR